MNFRVFLLHKFFKNHQNHPFLWNKNRMHWGYHFAMKDTTMGAFVGHSGIFGLDPGGKNMIFWRI